MTQTKMFEGVKLESIFHPSDFSEASEVAFVHALKIALVAGAKLTMLHVEASPSAEWQDFPGVRDTLERWGLIPKGSPKSAVGQLGIEVDQSSQVEQGSGESLSWFSGRKSYGSDRVGGSPARGAHALVGEIGGRADRAQGRTNDALHPPRRGGLRLATGRLDLASEHPHPGHEQTPPATERGSRRASDPQPPVASWHGHVAPRRTRCRNALAKAPQGHRLDLEQRGQGR